MYLKKKRGKTLIKREGGLFLGGYSVTVSVIFSLGFCQVSSIAQYLYHKEMANKYKLYCYFTVCIVSDNVCKEGVMSDNTHVSSFQPLSYVYCQ